MDATAPPPTTPTLAPLVSLRAVSTPPSGSLSVSARTSAVFSDGTGRQQGKEEVWLRIAEDDVRAATQELHETLERGALRVCREEGERHAGV